MDKFCDIKYVRPDIALIKKRAKQLQKDIKNAKNAEEIKQLNLKMDDELAPIMQLFVVAHIRNTMDTTDEFYAKEMEYFDKNLPLLSPLMNKLTKTILDSPFRKELEPLMGEQYFRSAEASLKVMNKKIIIETIKESLIGTEYSKTAAACNVEFMGEKCNFYGLLKHMQSPDRETRRAAFIEWAKLYESISDKLDGFYDKLLELRCRKAKKMGFPSYIEMRYLERARYDYGPADVARFRDEVVKYIVPAVASLYEEQRKRLGVEKLYMYDEQLTFPDGNAVPHGTKDEMVAAAQSMYRELSPETGEFFDAMVEHELFDLLTRPGKHLGGYCTSLPGDKMPFIFSNFNGTSADVDVLTHEAGHAFAYYQAARHQEFSDYHHSTSEINEIHSMSMEHFTYPWMDKFFGEKTGKYLYSHLASSLETIPYLCLVDHFQHDAVANPKMSHMERRACWRRLEKIYMPWRDYDGNEFLEQGGYWMQKQHIFLYPFYYVDYALAQVCAFQYYGRMVKDRKKAFTDYIALCRSGGSKGYFETLAIAGLENPFKEGTVKNITEFVMGELAKMKI